MGKNSYIDMHDIKGTQFGLKKIHDLLEGMGKPHEKLKVIHIAGTNGKGSVGVLLANILSLQGYKVGWLSSPTVFLDTEFAQIYQYDAQTGCSISNVISKEQLVIYEEKYGELLYNIKPSGFEVQVAYACQFFWESMCEIVIVETGLGGQLDATNVFEHTLCDIITSISLDHTDMLGDSIEAITMCKCGIITKNGFVVTTSSNNNVIDIIYDYVKKNNSEIVVANIEEICNMRLSFENNTFNYKGNEYVLKLNGKHQVENALIVIEALEVLKRQGYSINHDKVLLGMRKVRNKGRLDVVLKRPLIIADGAHNIAGIKCLLDSLEEYFPNKEYIFLINIFKDKEYVKMIELLASKAKRIIFFNHLNVRSLDSETMYNIANKYECKVSKRTSLKEALIEQCNEENKDSLIVCAGSLSFMKDVYDFSHGYLCRSVTNMPLSQS